MYKDDIIRIIPQTPVRVFKLSYMQGESLIKLAQGVSTIKNIQTNLLITHFNGSLKNWII